MRLLALPEGTEVSEGTASQEKRRNGDERSFQIFRTPGFIRYALTATLDSRLDK